MFGELAVRIDGAPADLGGPEPRALLALHVAAEDVDARQFAGLVRNAGSPCCPSISRSSAV